MPPALRAILFMLLACAGLLAGIGPSGIAGSALALESAPVSTRHATASMVSEVDAVVPGRPFRVALRLVLAPGWHTYWRNPGDAGVPPELELDLPTGAAAGPIAWPAPQRVAEGPLMTYAYTGEVLLPVTVTPPPEGGVAMTARANWLVCREICVPEEATFRLDLPRARPQVRSRPDCRSRRGCSPPPTGRCRGRRPGRRRSAPTGTLSVRGPELSRATVEDAWFIPDAPGAIRDSAPQSLAVRDGGFTLALSPGKAFRAADGVSGVLTVRDRSGLQTVVALRAQPATWCRRRPPWGCAGCWGWRFSAA
ncbi:MAG: protein-disulfide reductase DsbD domain-containing protein [Acetobacteraceae bacterium]